MKGMDEYTFIHALHICVLSLEMGRGLGLSREGLEELGMATLLHDVGKVFVPLSILRKPAPLDEGEFAVMSRHPLDGALALVRAAELPEVASVVAFEHHVHLDHSGYPRMREPRPLNMYSLIASIADVYDALTTMRPYRPQLSPQDAVAVMREQYSTRLEPRLLARFFDILGPYPWGTLLLVGGERLAVVTRPNADAKDSPFVRVIEVENGHARAHEEELPLQDLVRQEDGVEIVDPAAVGVNLTAALHGTAASGVSDSLGG
jgi:HD-GYP domain-containing protein (c-di-GMP phosphodiesterase class II)